MNIKILGTRGEIEVSSPYHSHHSGILVDKKILFDVGEESFLEYQPKYIFITHFHPDHAYFVRSLGKISSLIHLPFSVYGPEKYKEDKRLNVLTKKIKIDSYKITPVPTIHSKKVKSQGYLIEKDKQRIFYTGDMVWIEKKYHYLIKNLDLVITEASFIKKGGMVRRDKETGKVYGHNGIPNLINFFKSFTKDILFVHFGNWFYKNINKSRKELMKLGKEAGIKVFIGYDGMEFNLKNV